MRSLRRESQEQPGIRFLQHAVYRILKFRLSKMALAFIRCNIVPQVFFYSEISRGGSMLTECTEIILVKAGTACLSGIFQALAGFRTIDERNLSLTKTEDVLALTEKKVIRSISFYKGSV